MCFAASKPLSLLTLSKTHLASPYNLRHTWSRTPRPSICANMSSLNTTAEYEFKKQLTYGCHAKIDGYGTSYGYVPSLAAGIVFCVLFGLSMLLHTLQLVWKRTWWCSVFVLGCISMSTPSTRVPFNRTLTRPSQRKSWAGQHVPGLLNAHTMEPPFSCKSLP